MTTTQQPVGINYRPLEKLLQQHDLSCCELPDYTIAFWPNSMTLPRWGAGRAKRFDETETVLCKEFGQSRVKRKTCGQGEEMFFVENAIVLVPPDIRRMHERSARQAILRDIDQGKIPESVKSFGDLHEYTDANRYVEGLWIVSRQAANDLIEDLDRWLRNGSHRN